MSLIDKINKYWKKIALSALVITSLSINPYSSTKQDETISQEQKEKYALIYSADTYKDGFIDSTWVGGGTKNTYLISTANIYESLKKQGYKDENITIVYFDGKADYNETKDSTLIKKFEEEKGEEIKAEKSGKKNLKSKLDLLSKKASLEDEVLIYITGHGYKNYVSNEFHFELPTTNENLPGYYEKISPTELTSLIDQIPAKNKTVVLDFCYSGKFGSELYKQGINTFTATDSTTVSMNSRDSQFGRGLINAKINKEADTDKNGAITWEEAFDYSEEQRLPILKQHKAAGHYHKLEMVPGQKYITK
ncbi:MAG: C13 family peptidase [Nanoarchaeota archaeon]|nr:C13 family peptidase [Nanoarchaeota archaeon]MBU1269820.1 C13 family peptidase [Nanoarchaeota archaeon]MBU1604875.1 C13 family peptidase [Nanoarchaeota archaeon]MBU2443152.1 C13 family peptidase [Nanoarchaeota archaeon]